MDNPSVILSKKDVELLKSKNIKVPDKQLNDDEWDKFIIEIVINLEQDDSERIVDMLADNHS